MPIISSEMLENKLTLRKKYLIILLSIVYEFNKYSIMGIYLKTLSE